MTYPCRAHFCRLRKITYTLEVQVREVGNSHGSHGISTGMGIVVLISREWEWLAGNGRDRVLCISAS